MDTPSPSSPEMVVSELFIDGLCAESDFYKDLIKIEGSAKVADCESSLDVNAKSSGKVVVLLVVLVLVLVILVVFVLV